MGFGVSNASAGLIAWLGALLSNLNRLKRYAKQKPFFAFDERLALECKQDFDAVHITH